MAFRAGKELIDILLRDVPEEQIDFRRELIAIRDQFNWGEVTLSEFCNIIWPYLTGILVDKFNLAHWYTVNNWWQYNFYRRWQSADRNIKAAVAKGKIIVLDWEQDGF